MRRVRRRGAKQEKVFGCDLLEHLTASNQEIPQVLRCCSEFVEKHGVVDGIYRLSGVSSNIQKLRGEFENEPTPDLNKDVYLQDIHCVSSLCKAYFRELPNPLLTYQLYDKFAEAVAIQLEEERLVKIRDVLKELPTPHYRTLEFLMRHLVTMASHSSETNMHSRNLAIVWAPNLLRSKDIEASGFNGTAAFMEVRVQSIVVEFILTHIPQLFPELGVSNERRNSLPSPSALSNQGEGIFKCVPTQPFANIGNLSPGDGPLPIRPYHAIIEGTDKRKGSLKGKKWMSIFNIGGRFPDPRRKHKHSAKEKERPVLRPARSMDSLSTQTYPNEGSRRSGQRPPSTSMSPLVTTSPKPGSDAPVSAGVIGGSEYAVTYRRGTGLVSGGAGTQGTYTALDPEGLGIAGNESLQSRSPGLSTKVGRRAAMHITGPTIVTVPLHITSNLALGVLQGGGGDRVIHRGRDKDGGDRGESNEGRESVVLERKVEDNIKVEEKGKHPKRKDRGGVVDLDGSTVFMVDSGEEKHEGAQEEEKMEEEVKEECRPKPELVTRSVSREQRTKSLNTNDDVDDNDEYMDMKGVEPAGTQHVEDGVFDASDVLNSTEAGGDDHELSGYVQDNFEFLDQMDCSAMDHMECSISYQMNEFSVEPPGHSDDEYELMAQSQNSAELQTHLEPGPETYNQSPNELNPHRPLSLDLNTRYTKSLSLPYMTSPVHEPEEHFSEDEDPEVSSDEEDYSSEDDESMFCKSLPTDFFLNVNELEIDTDTQEPESTVDGLVEPLKSSEEREAETLNMDGPAAGEQQQQPEVKDEDKLEEKLITKKEEEDVLDKDGDQQETQTQSRTAEEELSVMEVTQSELENSPTTSDMSAKHFVEFPLPPDEDIEEEKEELDDPHGDHSLHQTDSSAAQEIEDVSLEESREISAKERDSDECKETEAANQEDVLEIKENHKNMCGEPTEEGGEIITDRNHGEEEQEDGKEQDSAICTTGSEISDELEDIICEVIEDEESEQAARELVAGQHIVGEEIPEEKVVEVEEEGANKTDVSIEVEKELMERSDEKFTDPEMQHEFEEQETFLLKTNDLEEAVQDEAQHNNKGEVVSKEPEKENDDKDMMDNEQLRTQAIVLKQPKEVKPVMMKLQEGRKCEESDICQGGVGRKLVISKSPKFYQVKAVPVVPPKPQHCKITALTLRQQQHQRERRDAENVPKVLTEQDKVCAGDGGEKERERRRDVEEGAVRDSNRSSPISMCFDEAVAIATMRREKEKVCEKEKERQREWGSEVQ